MGALYVVATPIGNLEDITLRAIRVLSEVELIAAEDTRTTRKLLSNYHIRTPLTSYHDHNKRGKLPFLLQTLKEKDVALVSEAGMPGINDPGYELVLGAIDEGIPVIPVPGPSAVTAALAVSGLPTDQFLYLGFLPRRRNQRKRALLAVSKEMKTLVIFESPHRLRQCLEDLRFVLGERRIAVCRELTKLYEEVFRGTLSESMEHFMEPRGEFTLIVEGSEKGGAGGVENIIEVKKTLLGLLEEGMMAREAVAKVAKDVGLTRREVYRVWVAMKNV